MQTSSIKLRGLRFQKLNFRLNSREARFFTTVRSNNKQNNRYHKTTFLPKRASANITYAAKFIKEWLYCTNLLWANRFYFGLFKAVSGITYLLPLIDSVSLGDKIRLYHNATRFYYFLKTGSVVPLRFLKTNFIVSRIGQNKPIFALSAGTYVKLRNFTTKWIQIYLPSGQPLKVNSLFYGFIGRNSGIYSNRQYLGKASVTVSSYKRVIVRSCAKNPVDHPNGGRTRGKMLAKTP